LKSLGWLYRIQGEGQYNKACYFEQAEELFKKALELNPQYVWARNGLIGLYWKRGELSKSEEVLREFLATNPKNDWAHRILVSLYKEMNRRGLANKKIDELRFNEYRYGAITINNYRKLK
jgi:tetratricopeptide (TPR) repeat protein